MKFDAGTYNVIMMINNNFVSVFVDARTFSKLKQNFSCNAKYIHLVSYQYRNYTNQFRF